MDASKHSAPFIPSVTGAKLLASALQSPQAGLRRAGSSSKDQPMMLAVGMLARAAGIWMQKSLSAAQLLKRGWQKGCGGQRCGHEEIDRRPYCEATL